MKCKRSRASMMTDDVILTYKQELTRLLFTLPYLNFNRCNQSAYTYILKAKKYHRLNQIN